MEHRIYVHAESQEEADKRAAAEAEAKGKDAKVVSASPIVGDKPNAYVTHLIVIDAPEPEKAKEPTKKKKGK